MMRRNVWVRGVLILTITFGFGFGLIEDPASAAGCATATDIKGGVKNVPGGSDGDGCDIHHVPSQFALDLADVPIECWPVLNIPHDPDHKNTRTHGPSMNANDARAAEHLDLLDLTKGATLGQRLLNAFDKHADFFMQDMARINSPWLAEYQRAIDEARAALVQAIQDGKCDGSPPPSGVTVAGNTFVNPPNAPPGAGVSVSSTAGGLTPGQEYDILFRDSARIAQGQPPVIISPYPAVVNSSGNIPSTAVTLGHAILWESQGEVDTTTVSTGQAEIYFLRSHIGTVKTATATVQVSGC